MRGFGASYGFVLRTVLARVPNVHAAGPAHDHRAAGTAASGWRSRGRLGALRPGAQMASQPLWRKSRMATQSAGAHSVLAAHFVGRPLRNGASASAPRRRRDRLDGARRAASDLALRPLSASGRSNARTSVIVDQRRDRARPREPGPRRLDGPRSAHENRLAGASLRWPSRQRRTSRRRRRLGAGLKQQIALGQLRASYSSSAAFCPPARIHSPPS
jgi:hypothetical protein